MEKTFVVRYAGFVTLNVAASAVMTYLVCRSLGFEGLGSGGIDGLAITLPIAVMSLLVCLALFPILNRLRSPLKRLAAFYLAFNVVIIGFGVYELSGTALLLLGPSLLAALSQGVWFGIVAGHTFGLVPFAVLIVLNAAFIRFFFPRSAAVR